MSILLRFLMMFVLLFGTACASGTARVLLPDGRVVEVGVEAFIKGETEAEVEPGTYGLPETPLVEQSFFPDAQPVPSLHGVSYSSNEVLRYTGRVHQRGNGRVRLNLYPYEGSRIRVRSSTSYNSSPDNPCFPHRCGDKISGPFTNPEPREVKNMPACYYDAAGVLFYEREGKTCPYIRRFNSHEVRVEERRQEWLRRGH